ncbi:hypothetical protein [Aquirufa echingensis]|uniref:Septum formation initiator n=1 Tax=Aquirufa echingensis TaxID=3096516 RepID=A0ABW6CZH7_9BACT
MKTIISVVILTFFSFCTLGQITKDELDKEIKSLNQKILSLQNENTRIKKNSEEINRKLTTNNNLITKLENKNQELALNLEDSKKELLSKIVEIESKSESRITNVSQSLSIKTLWGIIAFLAAIILSAFLFWLFDKRQKLEKIEFANQLNKTKNIIEDNLEKEFEKQGHVIEAQIRLIEHQMSSIGNATSIQNQDHSLALKVADELTLIERTISLMDSGTKGLKQLSRSLEKIKDNLASNGYEIPVLLGKPFNQGMKIIPVSTIPDETLDAGVEIITKIIKPQVNFNDKMIQAAQIEVSVGY